MCPKIRLTGNLKNFANFFELNRASARVQIDQADTRLVLGSWHRISETATQRGIRYDGRAHAGTVRDRLTWTGVVRCSVRWPAGVEVAPVRAHPADVRASAAIQPGQLAGGFPTGHTVQTAGAAPTRLELAFGSRLP
jgi:hypothetical protein